MTNLKEWARKAFLEEPPWSNEHFEKVTETYIKELEDYMKTNSPITKNLNIPIEQVSAETRAFSLGYETAKALSIEFLKGKNPGKSPR
jgi:hypothetical protein